jgi:hypothetical protein
VKPGLADGVCASQVASALFVMEVVDERLSLGGCSLSKHCVWLRATPLRALDQQMCDAAHLRVASEFACLVLVARRSSPGQR